MSSLYSKYITEKSNRHIIEEPYGFITYEIAGSICYVWDFFIDFPFRKKGFGFALGTKVLEKARSKGCSVVFGTVELSAKNPSKSLSSLLRLGMKFSSFKGDLIYLSMEL